MQGLFTGVGAGLGAIIGGYVYSHHSAQVRARQSLLPWPLQGISMQGLITYCSHVAILLRAKHVMCSLYLLISDVPFSQAMFAMAGVAVSVGWLLTVIGQMCHRVRKPRRMSEVQQPLLESAA